MATNSYETSQFPTAADIYSPDPPGRHQLQIAVYSFRFVGLENYKTVLYRQPDGSWVADIPSVPGCYALMDTREAAVAELTRVFEMISKEYREKGQKLPADSTEIVNV